MVILFFPLRTLNINSNINLLFLFFMYSLWFIVSYCAIFRICGLRLVLGACVRFAIANTQLCQNSDLIVGVMENDAIMRMISERCNRLIVIFSNAFFESASNTFFVKFAQAISLEQRKRKIVPVVIEECDIPAQFSLYHKLRYNPERTYYNFWERLYESVQKVPKPIPPPPPT